MTSFSPVVCVPCDKWNVRVPAAVYRMNRYYREHAAALLSDQLFPQWT